MVVDGIKVIGRKGYTYTGSSGHIVHFSKFQGDTHAIVAWESGEIFECTLGSLEVVDPKLRKAPRPL